MTLSSTTNTTKEIQLKVELAVMGHEFDPNPISSLVSESLEYVMDSHFQREPAWVQAIREMGLEAVAFVSVCAILDHVSEEGGCAQAHGVIGQMANRFSHLCNLERRIRCGLAWNVLHATRECGLVKISTSKRGEPTTIVSMSGDFRKLLDQYNLWGLCGLARRPMIVKPIPHTKEAPGGYLSGALRKGMTNGTWSNVVGDAVVKAMNNIQDTSWTIESQVLDIAHYLLEPYMQTRETNRYSHDIALAVAHEFVGLPIWNPTYIDHRGRVGKQADLLSEQGNDLSRGLLRFYNEIEINSDGMYWLSVHIANSFSGLPAADGIKLDRLPFHDRVAWVQDNTNLLLDIAEEPIENKDLYWDGFRKGASTFQALASALELQRVLSTGMTSLPVMQDMSVNNYQWSAGLTRDTDLAIRTNLAPSDEPKDLHTDVANENRRAWEEEEREHDFMEVFMDNVDVLCDRNTSKPSSMVIGYGGKSRGIASQYMGKKTWMNLGTDDEPQWVRIANPDSILAQLDIPVEDHSAAAFALATDYEKSVHTVAPSAVNVTKFIRECVKVSNAQDQSLIWYSPSGVRVVNFPNTKIEFNLTAANCWLDQSCTQLKYTIFDNKLNKRKAMTSAPPQFTHSLDASHLHYSVVRFDGDSVACVHDCYGCHANYMKEFRNTIRNCFVDILLLDPLSIMAEAYGVQLPEYGDFDLEQTRKANYLLG